MSRANRNLIIPTTILALVCYFGLHQATSAQNKAYGDSCGGTSECSGNLQCDDNGTSPKNLAGIGCLFGAPGCDINVWCGCPRPGHGSYAVHNGKPICYGTGRRMSDKDCRSLPAPWREQCLAFAVKPTYYDPNEKKRREAAQTVEIARKCKEMRDRAHRIGHKDAYTRPLLCDSAANKKAGIQPHF